MLSERDTRSLRDIEQRLMHEDARFAAVMNTPVFDRRERRTRYAYDIVIGLAAVAAVICVALAGTGTFGASVTALGLAAATAYLRIQRFPIHWKPRERQPR